MKILADENCEKEIVQGLRALGHDVVSVAQLAPSINDEKVFALAMHEGRILLTNDHDFGLIAERARERPPVVMLMRLERVSAPRRVQIVLQAIGTLANDAANQFIVIEPNQVRSRIYEP